MRLNAYSPIVEIGLAIAKYHFILDRKRAGVPPGGHPKSIPPVQFDLLYRSNRQSADADTPLGYGLVGVHSVNAKARSTTSLIAQI